MLTLWLQQVLRIGQHSGEFILRSALDWGLDLVGAVTVSDSTEIAFPVPAALGIVVPVLCAPAPRAKGMAVQCPGPWSQHTEQQSCLHGRDNDKIKKPTLLYICSCTQLAWEQYCLGETNGAPWVSSFISSPACGRIHALGDCVFVHWSPPSHVCLNSQAVPQKTFASPVRWPSEIRFYLLPSLSYFVTELMWVVTTMKWWILWGSDFSPGCQMTASWWLVRVSMLLSLSFTIWLQCLTWLELKKSACIYGTRDLSIVGEVWEHLWTVPGRN